MQKKPSIINNQCIVILLHDNARLHFAKSVKQILLQLEWEVTSSVLSKHDIVGLLSLPVDASRTYGYTLLQLRRSPKMNEWMDCLERHRVLPPWDCPVAGEMEKSSRKWRKLLWLRYDSSSLQNKSILETKKW